MGSTKYLYDNHYSFINFSDLFISNIFIDYSSYSTRYVIIKSNDSHSNYSFGDGGSDSGGGATGGW